MQTDHGRNAERSRHDGGVRSAAAQIGRHPEDAFAIHRRGVGRREIMRHQDVRLVHGQKRLGRFPLQISNHAPRHVLDIEARSRKYGSSILLNVSAYRVATS